MSYTTHVFCFQLQLERSATISTPAWKSMEPDSKKSMEKCLNMALKSPCIFVLLYFLHFSLVDFLPIVKNKILSRLPYWFIQKIRVILVKLWSLLTFSRQSQFIPLKKACGLYTYFANLLHSILVSYFFLNHFLSQLLTFSRFLIQHLWLKHVSQLYQNYTLRRI